MKVLAKTKEFIEETGKISRFSGRLFSMGIKPPYEIKELLYYGFGFNNAA
jgi:phospholipid/cholesterol/gamma-HCH transport system permease protein